MSGINRFDQFPEYDFSFTEYQAQPFVPDLTGLDKTLADLQTEYDNLPNLEIPKYIQESPTDVAAVKQYKNKYTSLKDNIVDQFASGNITGGRRLMSEMQRTIEKDKQPGGDFYELENRYAQYLAEQKKVNEFFKDNPRLINYGLSQIGITDFRDPKTGEANPILGASVYKDFNQKEFNDWLNQTVDNIKDTLLDQGVSKRKLDSITTLYEFQELMGREFDDVFATLKAQLSPEQIQGLQQRYAAEKFYGNTNAQNPEEYIDNVLKGAAWGRARQELDTDRLKDDNEILLYKTKKEIDKAYEVIQMRSQIATNNSGMPDINNLKIGNNGEIIQQIKVPGTTGFRGANIPNIITSGSQNLKFTEFIQSEEAQQKYPELVNEYNSLRQKYGEQMDNMSEKEVADFTKNYYQQKKDKMSTDDAVINVWTGDTKKAAQENIIGKNGLGSITLMTINVQEPGKAMKPLTYEEFLDEYNMSPEEAADLIQVQGEMNVDNPFVPSGINAAFISKNGKGVKIVLSNADIQDARIKEGGFELSSVLFDGSKNESAPVFTGIPQIDSEYGRLKTIGEDVLTSDILKRTLLSPDVTEEEKNIAREKLQKIQNNPTLDKFEYRESKVISTKTGLPIPKKGGGNVTLGDITNLIQTRTANRTRNIYGN